MFGDAKNLRTALAVIVLSFAFLAGSIILASSLIPATVGEVATFQAQLRNSLVYSCEHEGNPLRATVQKILQENIHNSSHIQAKFFPNIPPAVLHRLIKAQVEAQRERLQEIAPVECGVLYPPPP